MNTNNNRVLSRYARAVLCAAALLLQIGSALADTAALWVLDQRLLKRVDLISNQFVQTITLPHAAEALAFASAPNVLWVLSSKH